jgi:hypothetical protein
MRFALDRTAPNALRMVGVSMGGLDRDAHESQLDPEED